VPNAGHVILHAQEDEANRSSDPHGVAGAVPALTRPAPCLDGQMPFGTVASAKPFSTMADG
jgi:hypothetical protein